jgi:hypothetical protein
LEARLGARWFGLTDLFFFNLFSTAGGEGKLCDNILAMVNVVCAIFG